MVKLLSNCVDAQTDPFVFPSKAGHKVALHLSPIIYTVELQWLEHLWDHEN